MSSYDIEGVQEQLTELMKEAALRGSIRKQIITLQKRSGTHKKENNIEERVVKNLKNEGVLKRLIDHFANEEEFCNLEGTFSELKSVLENVQSVRCANTIENHHSKERGHIVHSSGKDDRPVSTSSEHQICFEKSETASNTLKSKSSKQQKANSSISLSTSEDRRKTTNEKVYKKRKKKKENKMSYQLDTELNTTKYTSDDVKNSLLSKDLSGDATEEEQKISKDDNVQEDISINNLIKNNINDQKFKTKSEVSPVQISNDIDDDDFASLLKTDNKLKKEESLEDKTNSMLVKINPRKRHLHFEILHGKSFLDHLLEESFSMFVLFLYFRGQRFWTQPVPCNSQPKFNAGFIFELHANEFGNNHMADTIQLLEMDDRVHIALVRVLPSGEKVLVSSHFFEWRHILSSQEPQKTFTVELLGVGAESNVTVGKINFRLTLIPKLAKPLANKVILSQLELEKRKQTERDRIFLIYAKTWWKEYLSLRPQHAHRTVKIFHQDENSQIKPVFNFVHILRVGRPLLELPQEAAWFVSLILFESSSLLGALPAVEQWWHPHTFLCLKKGGSENHALLLCSLLLGFGLDAYVCIGTKEGNIPWAWVVTIGTNNQITFWESTNGGRYVHNMQLPNESHSHSYPYKTVGCIFNHKSFYANIQNSDKVKLCNFNIGNQTLWKNMSEAAISSIRVNINMSLVPGWTDPLLHSEEMESEMRQQITEHRQDINLSTRWDVELSHLIAPLLAMYEMEHKMGHTIGANEISELINKNIPDGFAFKALPIRIAAMNKRRVLGFCLQNPVMKSIVMCPEPDTKLALRVHTYVYPENVLSIWVIIACKFRTK